jgi:hypothetical protein
MSAIGAILVNSLSAVTLVCLLVTVIDDSRRSQRIADRHWREVEGE